MNLPWLAKALRLAGLILIIGGAVMFFSDDLSFRSETQTSSDTYEIHHMVVFSNSAMIPAVVSILLFASSFFIRGKRV